MQPATRVRALALLSRAEGKAVPEQLPQFEYERTSSHQYSDDPKVAWPDANQATLAPMDHRQRDLQPVEGLNHTA